MASNLLSLPAELLASIADELDANDYGSLRLCCKQAEGSTFPYFAKKFFSRRKFLRSYLSLSTLVAISESRFSPYLETFVLDTATISEDMINVLRSADRSRPYLQAFTEQTTILSSGWDRDMLTTAFEKLPSLNTITVECFDDDEWWEMGESGNPWDPEYERIIKYNGGYGLKTLLSNTGCILQEDRHELIVSVQTVLAAVSKANVRPKVLEIVGPRRPVVLTCQRTYGIDDSAFNLPAFTRQMTLPVIEGLEEILVDMHTRWRLPPPGNITNHFREFLGLPKKLRRLRIRNLKNVQRYRRVPDPRDDFWVWLGTDHKGKGKAPAGQQGVDAGATALPPQGPAPIALPYLRDLELCREEIPLVDLTRILKKVSPTLRKLTLHDLVLRDAWLPRHENDEQDVDVVKVEAELWVQLCSELATWPWEELYEVDFSGFGGLGEWHLSHFGDALAEPECVHFKELRIKEDTDSAHDPAPGRAEFLYRGPDVRRALRQVADDIRAAQRDGRHVFNATLVERRKSF
ncbi:hypothetical protein SLS53_008294 [Cytospora paraplurivora]|uniref:F-box domain-containing protein n=1 Tax=Cytospora paraplurivora TaxID=2898453 RepID=A0AAN9TZD7_9PEZI